jgi:6-pyruvoyltetrahydropterin/6-carboxytetrahydropterin synthase
MKYRSTKTYTHSIGLSACFRQWRAPGMCQFLHGYALQFKITFEGELDEKSWIVGFGDLKPLKAELEDLLDHKTIVAADDPKLATFEELNEKGIIQLRVLPAVGCEKFAEHVFRLADSVLEAKGYKPRCRVVSVECREHDGNSAIVCVDDF